MRPCGLHGGALTSAARTAVSRRSTRSAVIEMPHTTRGHHNARRAALGLGVQLPKWVIRPLPNVTEENWRSCVRVSRYGFQCATALSVSVGPEQSLGGQAWLTQPQTTISGYSTQFTRQSDAGRSVSFRFCPICGSTVYWEAEAFPGHIAVAVGSFADPAFPAPTYSGWEAKRHHWVEPLRAMAIHHSD